MKIKEYKKIGKIVDELLLYFLTNGHPDLTFDVSVNKKIVEIKIHIKNFNTKLLEELKENIQLKRELEVEEYGWELMGESDCSNELELIGLLIDEFSYEVKGDLHTLVFVRKVK